ncbi:MAG: ABC transporter transmembrane domain-containing protein, partial [Rhodospirillaceae bacterium]
MAGQSKADQALQGPLSDREGPGSYSTLSGLMPEIIVVSLFLNVLSLALPLVLLQVYDRIVPNAALGTLSFLVIGVGGALMLESILRLGRSYVTGWVGARFEHMSGVASLRRLLFTGIQDFEKTGSGVHLERMGALAVVKDFYAGQSLISIIDLPFAFLYLGIIYLLGGWLVVIPLVLLACFILTAYLLGRELKGAIKDRMTFDDRRINFIIEILNGSHTLKSMAMEAQMLRRYERLQETCGKGNYRVALASAWALSAGAFFSQATMVATVAVGAWLVVGQEMTMGALAACTLLAGRSLAPVQKVLGVWTRFQTIRLARARLQEIFALEPEAVAGLPEPQGVEGRLTLDNVSFQFDGTSEPMLKELNLDAAPGECIG